MNSIYMIINLKNDKRYIGQTTSPTRRWCVHKCYLRNNKHHCDYLQNAWNKYTELYFKFVILETDLTNEEADQREIELIQDLKEQGLCYNSANGGVSKKSGSPCSDETKKKISQSEKGKVVSEETRQKLRDSWKNRAPISEETRTKMSEARKGVKNHFYGKTHTEEAKKKISETTKASLARLRS